MAREYPTKSIGDVCYVTDGAHAIVERRDRGIPYLTSKNIGRGQLLLDKLDFISEEDFNHLFANTARAQRRPAPGDVLIGIIGTFGNAYLYRGSDHFGISSAVALLRPDISEVFPRFLYYVITSTAFQVAHSAYKSGSVQGYTNIPTIKRLPVPVPPLAEQRAIAHILGTLDDKIELNRRMNATLEAMARALFKSWFVDFDPVRAKMEGRDIGLPRDIADLFPDGFEESAVGEVPAGWRVGAILEQAELLSGGTPKTDRPEYWDGAISWASAKDVSQSAGPFIITTERSITEQGLKKSATRIIPAFCSIVIARGATTGRMTMLGGSMAMNQTCYALSSKTATPFLLYCRLREEMGELVHRAHGSIFNTITTDTFASSRTVLPPPSTLQGLEARIEPLFQRILNNMTESLTLAALRDALLPKLISGEVRVGDAARFAAEVLS